MGTRDLQPSERDAEEDVDTEPGDETPELASPRVRIAAAPSVEPARVVATPAARAESAAPLTFREKLVALLLFYGPLVLGIGLPVLAGLVAPRPNLGALIAIALLVPGLYVLAFAAALRGSARAPVNPWADLPRGAVHSRANGELVLVSGRIAHGPGGPLHGELTGKPCVWSELVLTTYEQGPRGRAIADVVTSTSSAPFVIVDGDTSIEVDPSGGTLRDAPHSAEAMLNGPGAPRVRRLLGARDLLEPDEGADALERSIAEGDEIVVVGVVERKTDDAGAYRGKGETVRLVGRTEEPLVVSGRPLAEVVAPPRSFAGTAIAGLVVTLAGLFAIAQMFFPR